MDTLLDRFIRYAKLDTQASEFGTLYPSTPKQLNLCRLLARECGEIGLADVAMSDFGVVTATLPSTVTHKAPAIAWFAHVDTSPEFTAENVQPTIHRNYDGKDIVLPADKSRVIRTAENPALKKLQAAHDHHVRRHDAPRGRRQVGNRRDHDGRRAPARSSGNPARADPRLLHLRRGDRPRRRPCRDRQARRRLRLHARQRRERPRRRRNVLRRPGHRHRDRGQHAPFGRQRRDGERACAS